MPPMMSVRQTINGNSSMPLMYLWKTAPMTAAGKNAMRTESTNICVRRSRGRSTRMRMSLAA